jgi:hypothetical protein
VNNIYILGTRTTNITNRETCYFVVYTPTKEKISSDLKYFIIKRDNRFWHEIGKGKYLETFYFGTFFPN